MNDKLSMYQRILGALKGLGSGANARGQSMMDAERTRNEQMMRENGMMNNEGDVATTTKPELFENPLPFAPQMADFVRRLQALRNK